MDTMDNIRMEASTTVSFEKDAFGNLRCHDFRQQGFRPALVKGKIVIENELEAWKVTKKMTAKEQRKGTFNPEYPLGPYRCQAHKHWHIGHSSDNIGRKPSRMIRFQMAVEVVGKKVEKIQRTVRNRVAYYLRSK